MKGFVLGLALKQRQKATRKSPIRPGSEWVEKVDQLNQPETVDSQ